MVSHTLELAQHLRAIHGLDMESYIRAHGHSRVRTAYLDCAMCAESVMHDLGAFRRHLVVVHAGVSMEKYFERYVIPVMQQDRRDEEEQVVRELDLESLQHPESRKIQVTASLNLSDLIG